EGQYLLIPVTVAGQSAAPAAVTAPGSGTPTPVPPSASKPLPDQTVAPAVGATKPAGTPTSPALGESRSAASAARYAMPVDGKIIRGYAKGKNEGIDIAANAGTPVRAASDGTVAVITKDTNQVLTLVIRNSDDLLTVYAGIDGATVAKGDKIKRGQTIAKVRAADPAFLHFEVRKGMDSQDPTPFLQ
ncbi:MAG: peptidoglycan DD-metalloendopeptidase family protein, partial [Paracoccaceae bacterium]|nr:peptidoglycan DD-metalloendopeptidase family protein [Paracoccaceae bacterium]